MAKVVRKVPPATTSGRYLCDILKNMRQCYDTRNFSYLPGLIEEAQYRAERMEDALEKIGGYNGLEDLEKGRKILKEEIRELKKEKRELLLKKGAS